jgi:hypothetical protein
VLFAEGDRDFGCFLVLDGVASAVGEGSMAVSFVHAHVVGG